MDILMLVGRILFGGFFIMSGINHFTKLQDMSRYAGAKDVPAPRAAVAGSGLLLVLGGLSILLGYQIGLGVLLLAVFLVPVSLKMHNFWAVEDPQARQMEMVNFLKNMALLGAALVALGLEQPWPYSLG